MKHLLLLFLLSPTFEWVIETVMKMYQDQVHVMTSRTLMSLFDD